jgi:hypothetical protein
MGGEGLTNLRNFNRPVPIIKKAVVSYLTCSESDIVHPNEDLGM